MKAQTQDFLTSVFYKSMITEAATTLLANLGDHYVNIHLNHTERTGEIHVCAAPSGNGFCIRYTADLMEDPDCLTEQVSEVKGSMQDVAQALYNCAYAHKQKKDYNPEAKDAPLCEHTLADLLEGMQVNFGQKLKQCMSTLATDSTEFLIATMLEAATPETLDETNNRITRLLLEDAMQTIRDYSDNELTLSGLPVEFLGIHAQTL